MAGSAFLDVCRFNPTLGGTTDWTYSSFVTGYNSPSAAGVVNGVQYSYRAEAADLSQWEIGTGTYNTSTGVLSRTTILFSFTAGTLGTSKVSFSTVPQVAVIALKEDLTVTTAAAKSDQQAATSAVLAVTPAHMQDHDGVAKAWVNFVGATGAINSSSNVTSVTRTSAGNYNVTFTTAFANALYSGHVTPETSLAALMGQISDASALKTTTQVRVFTFTLSGAATDPLNVHAVFYGRQ